MVWYDLPGDYTPFIHELRGQQAGAPLPAAQVESLLVEELTVGLCCYAGYFLAVRMAVEDRVAGERPEPLLIYVPGVAYDAANSLLLELELAGLRYEPNLKRDAARPVLRQHMSDGAIDELFTSPGLTYTSLATAIAQTGDGGPSALRLALPHDRCESGTFSGGLQPLCLCRRHGGVVPHGGHTV